MLLILSFFFNFFFIYFYFSFSSRSIARMVVLYREFLLLVGYTGRVFELLELIEHVRKRDTEEIEEARDPQEFEENEKIEKDVYSGSCELDEDDDGEGYCGTKMLTPYEGGKYIEGDH